MEPSNFRGPQPPTSHIIPGAFGIPGHPPQVPIIDPPFVIPGAFLTEIIAAIRHEFSSQGWYINDRFSSVNRGYTEMNARFDECVRQSDKILAEQGARLETRLEGIQNNIRQFHDSQTAANVALKERLNSLEDLIKTSRETLDPRIATVVEAIGHRFEELSAMVNNSNCSSQDQFTFESGAPAFNGSLRDITSVSKNPGESSFTGDIGYEPQFHHLNAKGVLFPAAWSQTNSEAGTIIPPTLPHRSPLGSEGFHGERSTELPPVATLSESEPPSASPGNSPEPDEEDQLLLTSPRTTPPEHIPDTPTPRDTPCDVSQDLPSQDLFDATSPLTQLSTSCAEDQEIPQTPIGPPEDAIPMLCPHSDALLQKRKRASNRSKKSRRNKRLRCQAEQDPVEETHADPSIWPPAVEGDTNQKYISCDRCAGWYHPGCVALQTDHEDLTPWECPPCTKDPTRGVGKGLPGSEKCSRPGCDLTKSEEYFMDRLVGRCYERNQGLTKYLVAYEGYDLTGCTWEAAESFANDSSKIDEFLEWWATENPMVDIESLDPHETIFISDAYTCARKGMTWPGA